ncbi:MAG: DUF2130 domain-containing protein [Patescibacteria group bacterium]
MNDTLTITCPHCKQLVSLDEAFTHQIEEKYRKNYASQLERDKAELTKIAEAKATQQVKEKMELEMKNTRDELTEAKERNKQLLEQLTELNKILRDLKRKDEERSLEMQKKLVESEEKIRLDAQKKADEEHRLKFLEKDKQLQNALREADELKRKLSQGSQQNQGEVLELELENLLKQEFPNDKITPVGKGIRGADLVQEVWDRNGVRCGVILWETKNAKWNEEWIDKLKNDQRQLKAELAVIISEQLPEAVKGAAYRGGVWLAHRSFAIGIGMALRANLIQSSFIRRSMQRKNNDEKDNLWNYFMSNDFKQRMEVLFETYDRMKMDLEKEKRAYTIMWAKREKQIQRIMESTSQFRGDLEGVMGNALPQMKQLELTGNAQLNELTGDNSV